ncbi:hypothetical protein PILCRDRAFT_567 [Piloderma croceum F 1598]|uniref:Uncharacterized protein n=1 Tax=Piloderma croceum (strain F 1598) TaxID=765440 RepID=A0A0C3GI80_PILCF|nr:hypothetical protein PILCRDRAFT_567 [Piloderma croceum F 1598]
MPSEGSSVTPLPVPQIVEKFPIPSRDPPSILSPARPKMLLVKMRQPLPLKNNMFPSPQACKIYPIRHGGRYGKVEKPEDKAAADVSQKIEDRLIADGWNRLSGSPQETAPTSSANPECVLSQDALLVKDGKIAGLTVINLPSFVGLQGEKMMSTKKTRKSKKVHREQPAEHKPEHECEHIDLAENSEIHRREKMPGPAQSYVPSTESMWISVGMFAVAVMVDFFPWKSLWRT